MTCMATFRSGAGIAMTGIQKIQQLTLQALAQVIGAYSAAVAGMTFRKARIRYVAISQSPVVEVIKLGFALQEMYRLQNDASPFLMNVAGRSLMSCRE